MILYLTILHYILLGVFFWQAFSLLKVTRGNSILAIFSIAVMVQTGLGWGYYVYVNVPSGAVDKSISDVILIRMAISLCLTSALFIVGIALFKAKMPRLRPAAPDNLGLSSEFKGILFVCAIAFMGLLLGSPSSRYVIQHGADVLGGGDYYQVRSELIQIGTDNASGRLEHRFMSFTYGLLLLAGLVFLYKYSITKRLQFLAAGALCAAAPVMHAFLSFQKGPIVTVICILTAALILFHKKEGKVRVRLVGVMGAASVATFLAAMSYVIFQGAGADDAGANVMKRLFIVPINGAAMHHSVYPHYFPFVKFGDIGTIRALSPIGVGHVPMYGSMSREVAMTLRGLDYNANTGIVGHGWGTWGHFGVILFVTMAIAWFALIDRFTAKRRHLASTAPLVIYYWFFFIHYGNTNLHNFLSASSLFVLPFLYFRIFGKGTADLNNRAFSVGQVKGDRDANQVKIRGSRQFGNSPG